MPKKIEIMKRDEEGKEEPVVTITTGAGDAETAVSVSEEAFLRSLSESAIASRPADAVGAWVLDLALALHFPDVRQQTAARLMSAPFLEQIARNADWLMEDYRRNLSKFLENPEGDLEKFKYEVPMVLVLRPYHDDTSRVAPMVISKLGAAKIPTPSRNALAAQLELF